ncbi:TrmB family transcriptional regulator [Paenibacillus sp. P96]|uniref:TrmB family transcriptional regulator n=1 Tax=Paenibacillus zeirhizosphaerae TaxID=2987519 RepID=A0ABT9FUZ8_9BACL|nr:TrmB family transcriptional regulator [Paenibacillus sp. P96]MDP4098558.1 TrmB family transcriptional regulator [Paenibacillus sp. P96]
MEQLLHHLKNLGFTDMEAKVMVELAKNGDSSGYEVSKRTGASRSNVYAALQRLAGQGFLHTGEGEPVRYSMLPVEELTRIISGRLQESLETVERAMPRPGSETPFHNMEGDKEVLASLARELGRAKYEIVVDVWREEAALVCDQLEEAEQRGVRVLWACDSGEAALGQWLPRGAFQADAVPAGRKFSFVVDRRWCMLGMRGDRGPTQAVVTEHPVMTELLLNQFAQDVVLYEMENDMGAELSSRYGWRYETIIGKYVSGGPRNV